MPRGVVLPPGPSLYPECHRPGTSGQRRHWVEGTVTCALCREQGRLKLRTYREKAAVLGRRQVSALGTQRRIQALNRIGYTRSDIAVRMGVTAPALHRLLEQEVCYADTAKRVERVYRELVSSGVPGKSLRTRNRAIAAGWAGPMDWEDIDNPTEVPLCVLEQAYAADRAFDRQRARQQAKRASRATLTEEQRELARAANRRYRANRRTADREMAAA